MTAKHRKSKNHHKHEENFLKNDVVESAVRTGANSSSVHLVLFLVIVIGGAVGLWFCFQQHQTLTQLTDSVAGMQMKIMKLQSANEEFRQSGTKQHLSESLETRLNVLEESSSLAQKQLGMALATAEQLRSSDLPAQVLSLHTEMKTRLAEMQQATVSLEQLSQVQTTLKGKSEEFEVVRSQVDGLAALSSELSHKVEVLTGSLREAESKLDERAGQAATLSSTLDAQVVLVHSLKEQVEMCQGQLEARTHDVATVRELLQSEESKWLQQASMEEQLRSLQQSLQDQISAAHNLTTGLQARLDDIQKQVAQLVEKSADPEDQAPVAEPEDQAPPAEPEDQAPVAEPEDQAPPAEPEDQAPVAEAEDQAPPAGPEDQAPPSEPQNQAPPAKPEDQSPPAETEGQNLPAEEDASAGTEEEQAPPAGIVEEEAAQDEAQQEVTGDVASAEDPFAEKEDVNSIETEGAESTAEEVPEEPDDQPESLQEQKKDETLGEEEPQEVKQLEEETAAGDEEEHEQVLGTDEGLAEESQSELEVHEEVKEVQEPPRAEEHHEEEEEEFKGNDQDEDQDFPAEWESHSREEPDEEQELESPK